jgi:hypothetical protein
LVRICQFDGGHGWCLLVDHGFNLVGFVSKFFAFFDSGFALADERLEVRSFETETPGGQIVGFVPVILRSSIFGFVSANLD